MDSIAGLYSKHHRLLSLAFMESLTIYGLVIALVRLLETVGSFDRFTEIGAFSHPEP